CGSRVSPSTVSAESATAGAPWGHCRRFLQVVRCGGRALGARLVLERRAHLGELSGKILDLGAAHDALEMPAVVGNDAYPEIAGTGMGANVDGGVVDGQGHGAQHREVPSLGRNLSLWRIRGPRH